MPIYNYETQDGEQIEYICSYSDRPSELVGSDGRIAKLTVSIPAKTAYLWGKAFGGVDGQFDYGLGRVIYNEQHRRKVADELGVVSIEDAGYSKHWAQDHVDAVDTRKSKEKARTQEYDNLLAATGGDHLKVQEVLWTPKQLAADGYWSDK